MPPSKKLEIAQWQPFWGQKGLKFKQVVLGQMARARIAWAPQAAPGEVERHEPSEARKCENAMRWLREALCELLLLNHRPSLRRGRSDVHGETARHLGWHAKSREALGF